MTDQTIAARAAALRAWMAETGLDALLIPKWDRHLGEYLPAADERLTWATGFTGSAGVAILLAEDAFLCVDGRYELQAAVETDVAVYTPSPLREIEAKDRLASALAEIDAPNVGYDPWLHPMSEVETYGAALQAIDGTLVAVAENPIDALWSDRPARPSAPAEPHPEALAGRSAAEKRADLAETLRAEGLAAAVLTQPDGVNWLLNIRGRDLPHTPVMLSYAVQHADGRTGLFCEPAQVAALDLGDGVDVADWSTFPAALADMSGARVAVDRARAPAATSHALSEAGAVVVRRQDVSARPKAMKSDAELDGARAAHLRDAAAMVAFLAWLDAEAPSGALTELAVSDKVTEFRRATAARLGSELVDTSFDPIVGFGPNGAIVHYRVSPETSLPIRGDGLLLIDSGGQYRDGTTDVTRTVAVGAPSAEERAAVTAVLRGMIAVSQLRFPEKIEGRRIEAFGRAPLWSAGRDFEHGVGHGVGSFLSVHEGPAGLSKRAAAPIEAGMILSNEPGCYVAGRYGVRIENLVIVTPAEARSAADLPADRPTHGFETLTLIPIDRRLIVVDALTDAERIWLNRYHARVRSAVAPLLADAGAKAWLRAATEPMPLAAPAKSRLAGHANLGAASQKRLSLFGVVDDADLAAATADELRSWIRIGADRADALIAAAAGRV